MRVSLILPTYNEASNVTEVLERVYETLDPFEVIIVDDNSPDGTWKAAEDLQTLYPSLKVIRRIGRKGLSSAVMEGFAAATGDVLMVMDADLQHDPSLLPRLEQAIEEGADVVVASRYAKGGDTEDWRWMRLMLSRVATGLVHLLVPPSVTDPMSGFFAIRRDLLESVRSRLHPQGFKILFEILSFLPKKTRIAEVPLHFGIRTRGESKLTLLVQLQFVWQVCRIAVRRFQYLLFVGTSLILAVFLLMRTWDLRLLYIDAHVRTAVQSSLQSVTENRGWLLSDMRIDAVFPDHVRLIHREHVRGKDPSECIDVFFDSDSIAPCAD